MCCKCLCSGEFTGYSSLVEYENTRTRRHATRRRSQTHQLAVSEARARGVPSISAVQFDQNSYILTAQSEDTLPATGKIGKDLAGLATLYTVIGENSWCNLYKGWSTRLLAWCARFGSTAGKSPTYVQRFKLFRVIDARDACLALGDRWIIADASTEHRELCPDRIKMYGFQSFD